jgi:hypothetical protein
MLCFGVCVCQGDFSGDTLTKQLTRLSPSYPIRCIALIGLGPNPKDSQSNSSNSSNMDQQQQHDLEVTSAGRLGRISSTLIKENRCETAGIVFPFPINNAGITQCLLGLYDSAYADNRYKKVPDGGHKPGFTLKTLQFLGVSDTVCKDISITSMLTSMIASGVTLAKDLVGTSVVMH